MLFPGTWKALGMEGQSTVAQMPGWGALGGSAEQWSRHLVPVEDSDRAVTQENWEGGVQSGCLVSKNKCGKLSLSLSLNPTP